MQKFPDSWSMKDKISYLQRKILLNSILYYMYNDNAIDDYFYDSICKQLVVMQNEYGDISDTEYGYAFYDFEGSTGFYLYGRLTKEDKNHLLKITERFVTNRYDSFPTNKYK